MAPYVLISNSDARGYHIDHVPIAAGDIAYADYWLREEIQGFLRNTTTADGYKVYESLLNQYYDEMSVITSKKSYMVGPVNHEANCKIHPLQKISRDQRTRSNVS